MDWILILDADETLSNDQKIISREINSKIKNVAYMLNTINESSTTQIYNLLFQDDFQTIKIFILKIRFMNKLLNHWKK